ncbi:hypothetical protein INT45_010462 [Circinella minor]|uniref:Uncharacterized protein n=1 Tax=Circinella minor TaxID=1195481 RepID=A0A8H7S0I7_9FUNG|nr:hypothetical protein INT45_010462 [Circinella minor]
MSEKAITYCFQSCQKYISNNFELESIYLDKCPKKHFDSIESMPSQIGASLFIPISNNWTADVEIVERRERAYYIDPQYRWGPSSIEFIIMQKKCATKQQDALSDLKILVFSRAMMNEELRGRAGKLGEHVSTKVKKSIVKIGKDAKKYRESYNEASLVLCEPEITWEEICNPAAPFWEWTIMQKEFDILRETMNKRCAEEELQLVEDELLRLKNYANSRRRAFELAILQEGYVATESPDASISSAENEYEEEEHTQTKFSGGQRYIGLRTGRITGLPGDKITITMELETSSQLTKVEEVIRSYLKESEPTLSEFVKTHVDFLIEHTPADCSSPEKFWSSLFSSQALKMKIKLAKGKDAIDWQKVSAALVPLSLCFLKTKHLLPHQLSIIKIAVAGLCPVAEKIISVRPDLVLYCDGTENGAGECGKEGNAKKGLVETSLHCPKVMKSTFLCVSNKCDNEKDLIRTIRIVCFAQFLPVDTLVESVQLLNMKCQTSIDVPFWITADHETDLEISRVSSTTRQILERIENAITALSSVVARLSSSRSHSILIILLHTLVIQEEFGVGDEESSQSSERRDNQSDTTLPDNPDSWLKEDKNNQESQDILLGVKLTNAEESSSDDIPPDLDHHARSNYIFGGRGARHDRGSSSAVRGSVAAKSNMVHSGRVGHSRRRCAVTLRS